MRFVASFFAFSLALLPALRSADISWNVRMAQTFADGITVQRAAFTDGEKNYALSIDDDTVARSEGAGTRFTYRGVPSAVFEVHPSPILPAVPFSDETLDRYRKTAKLRIPEGVAEVTTLEEVAEPLSINRWKSYRLNFSYVQKNGRKVLKSVTFLTLKTGQQAMLDTSSYEAEFKAAMERSDYLIRSWHELGLKTTFPDS